MMNNNVDIKKYARNFYRARGNLLAVVAFTLVNLLLIVFNVDWHFFFSATVPMLILHFTQELSFYYGNAIYVVGIILAFGGALLYFVFWLLSKRFRVFMLISLIVFGIDALVFLILILFGGFDGTLIINLAFSGWILYYLIIGTAAWGKLLRIPAAEVQAAVDAAKQEAEATETQTALNDIASGEAEATAIPTDENQQNDENQY
ncbi:MAG: hypothetical protein FWE04_06115 [Oscillospiraceae bacterium]|nr:hypothetical protein [Oscillospiraceae bacterium]